MIIAKFSVTPKLIASNFLVGESDPEAHGVRPGPQKRAFPPNLSPPRVLKWGGRVIPFWYRDDKAKKCLEPNFDFWLTDLEKWAKRQGWPARWQKFWYDFFIKGTPAQMGCVYFVILCSFVGGRTLWAAGVSAGGPRAENWKLEFGLFALKQSCSGPSPKTFCFYELFHFGDSWGPNSLNKNAIKSR